MESLLSHQCGLSTGFRFNSSRFNVDFPYGRGIGAIIGPTLALMWLGGAIFGYLLPQLGWLQNRLLIWVPLICSDKILVLV